MRDQMDHQQEYTYDTLYLLYSRGTRNMTVSATVCTVVLETRNFQVK